MNRTCNCNGLGTVLGWSALTFAIVVVAFPIHNLCRAEDATAVIRRAGNTEDEKERYRILKELSLDVATPDEARQMLQLKGADKVGF